MAPSNIFSKVNNIQAPKRVAFIITGLSIGGAEMMLLKLLSRIDRDRFAPIVISLSDRGVMAERFEALGLPVYVLGIKLRWFIPGLWRFVRLVYTLKPDIIQGWMLHGNFAAWIAGILSRRPVFWSVRHSSLPVGSEKKTTLLLDKFLSLLSAYPKNIVYNSKAGKDYHELIGYTSDRGVVIPNGFETDLFVPSLHARLDIRKELGLQDDALLIGMIGRYHPMKDHNTFLQAASLMLKIEPSIKFILSGSGCDNQNSELIALIKQLDLDDAVFLLGERRDIPWLMAALDIVVSSSSFGEGFANVIGEAMSCGVPCVVTDVGDSKWILGSGGVVVPPKDPEAMQKGWAQLIEVGDSGRRKIGELGRKRILDLFSINSVSWQYEALYLEAE